MSSSSGTDTADVAGSAMSVAYGLDAAPAAAAATFGAELDRAERYAGWLAGPGTERGVIGPGEVGRLWDRHLLNGALLADAVPSGAHVVDLGSGGGLPGIPLALARPDLRLTLVDSRLRRTDFLREVVADLALTERVAVVRARGEELRLAAGVVTARAVSDVTTVARWSAGLVHRDGLLLVLQGSTARAVDRVQEAALVELGWRQPRLLELSRAGIAPTWVVRAVRR